MYEAARGEGGLVLAGEAVHALLQGKSNALAEAGALLVAEHLETIRKLYRK